MFVSCEGELLDAADYEPTNPMSAYHKSTLADTTLKCSTERSDAGSHYSVLRKELLTSGQGPPLDTENFTAFESVKSFLYTKIITKRN